MYSEEEKRALEKSWAITCQHLDAAKECLVGQKRIDKEALNKYQEWLDHNELELALDELEAAGENSSDKRFWKYMTLAAENMGLQKHVARYAAHPPADKT